MKTRLWKSLALLLVSLIVAGSRPDCERRLSTVDCDTLFVVVDQAECVDIENPCDPSGEFTRVDGLRLCDAPDGIFVRTNRTRSGTTRQICAGASRGGLQDVEASYIYAAPGVRGEGVVMISVISYLSVSLSADPPAAVPGDTVQLMADVSGGTPPYTFLWRSIPDGWIDPGQTTLQNPVIVPASSGAPIYRVTVTDAEGRREAADLSYRVGQALQLFVSADRTVIVPGQDVQLTATTYGGDGRYSYAWSPGASLDDSTIATPVARPMVSTVYSCTVTDGTSATVSDSVLIGVQGSGYGACFDWTPANPLAYSVVTFDGSCSTGDIETYNWWIYSAVTDPPDISGPDPIAQTAFDLPGTYTVKLEIVERSTGRTASRTQNVVVTTP